MTQTEIRLALDIAPLSGTIGAVINGVDLRHLDEETVGEIRKIWLERKVVFFPGQHLDAAAHQEFAARFGELTEGHPVIPSVEGFPNVFEIDYSQGTPAVRQLRRRGHPQARPRLAHRRDLRRAPARRQHPARRGDPTVRR